MTIDKKTIVQITKTLGVKGGKLLWASLKVLGKFGFYGTKGLLHVIAKGAGAYAEEKRKHEGRKRKPWDYMDTDGYDWGIHQNIYKN